MPKAGWLCGNHGQSLLEFSIASLVLFSFFVSVTAVLKLQWHRAQCAYLVFEKTHLALIRASAQSISGSGVLLGEDGVQGRGYCGGVLERVDLPWLEKAQW